MTHKERMSPQEMHEVGIEIVSNALKGDGYEILSVNSSIETNPQITARKGNQLAFVVVRTALYPDKARVEEATHFQMIEHADAFDAIPFFASVVISNGEATTGEEKGIPVRGAGFDAEYEGLVILSRSDRLPMWDGSAPMAAAVGGLK